ncbi:MAG TPA: squalene/phytoene synthase family protein, partial [Abditibacterium sp.]
MPSATNSFDRAAALRQARAILRHHGKSYYYSTRLFPRELQEATCAVYAFVRLPDEIVDNSPQSTPEELAQVQAQLNQFLENWRVAYQTGKSSDAILQLNAEIWHQYKIPYEYSESFLRAMIQDTHQTDYADYADLEGYMYGSAAVIGLMMSHLVGFEGEKTLEHAQKLGYAMQLTNFLRDIDEDFQLRNRVYMPADELAKFNLSRK